MRSCTGAIVSLADGGDDGAAVQPRRVGPGSRSRHVAHSPATASGSPSARWMNIGVFIGLPALPERRALARRLPLVEAVHRDDQPVLLEQALERRLLGDGLGAGVDHLRADLDVLRPRRHQAPVERLRPRAAPSASATTA